MSPSRSGKGPGGRKPPGRGRPGAGKPGKGAGGKKPSSGRGGRTPPPTKRSATPGRPPAKRSRGRTGPVGTGRGARAERPGLGGEQVEGIHAVRELLLAGRRRVHEVLISTDRERSSELDDIRTLAGQMNISVLEHGRSKLDAAARTSAHQGVIARGASLPESDLDDLVTARGGATPFLLACDGVTDPGNLGALLRTAECAGVTGIVLARHRAVHVTPAVTKAAAGAIEHLDFAIVGGMPAALARADELGALVIGLDMGGDVSIHDLPPVDRPVVVVVGAEGRGLGRLVRERCEVVASVPMAGAIESLNVSVAGALALYEVVRLRNAAGS